MKKIHQILLTIIILSIIIYACSYESASDSFAGADSGQGGSMARFTVVGDYLYAVDNEHLKAFDISSIEQPEYKKETYVGSGVETIFPLNNNLFLGTTNGMYIYNIVSQGEPQKISFYEHVIACDPVVSDGDFAYVTLSSGRDFCWRAVDELQILDLKDMSHPQLIKQYSMEGPRGLAIRNDSLWVCDKGLKLLDVGDKQNIRQLNYFNTISAYDIILDHNRALVIGENGFVQYKFENDSIVKISQIDVNL